MSDKRQQNFILLSQVFAGMGIGILMGLIIGLSVSPVVKSILGTLSGLLGVFLGLQDSIFGKKEVAINSLSPIILSSVRTGSFGIFCVLAILFGLYLRTHDTIGMSVENQVKKWTDAGYDSTMARELAMYEKLNMTSMKLLTLHEKSMVIESDSLQKMVSTPEVGGSAGGFLFSYKSLPKLTSILNPNLYVDGEVTESNLPRILSNYTTWEKLPLDNYVLVIKNEITSPQDQILLIQEVSNLSHSLYGSEEDYKTLKEALNGFNNLKQWPSLHKYPELQSIMEVAERNLEPELMDQFLSIISDVLYKIDFEDE